MQVVRELADLGPDVDQLALHVGDHRLRLELGRDLPFRRAQDQAQRRDLLHHAVVQLAGDPGPLLLLRLHQALVERADLRRVPLDDPHASAIGGPEQRREQSARERAKPVRLVVRRCDGEIQHGGAIVPDAVAVGRDHAEGIRSREANPYRTPAAVYRRRANHGHSRRADSGISPSVESQTWARCSQSASHGGAGEASGLPLPRVAFRSTTTESMYVSAGRALCDRIWTGPPSARQNRSQTIRAHPENTPRN